MRFRPLRLRRPPPAWLLVAAFAGCDVLDPPDEDKTPADLVLRNVSLTHHVGGDLRARARFEVLRYHRGRALLEGDGLRFTPVREGRDEGLLTAKKGSFKASNGIGDAQGDVTFRATTGELARTPHAGLDVGRRFAWGNKGVTLEADGLRVKAPLFKLRWDGPTHLRLHGGVTTVLAQATPPPAKKPARPKKSGSRR